MPESNSQENKGMIDLIETPSTNGSNGDRDSQGRFAKGNSGGPGNPYGRSVAKWRELFQEAVTDQDFREIIAAMVQKAKEGDMVAAREVLNRLAGRPAEAMDPERKSMAKRQLELRERQIDIQEEASF